MSGKCQCGRNHKRIDRIRGRYDDILITNGVNIFSIRIEKTIMKFPKVGNGHIIEILEEDFMDKPVIKIETSKNTFYSTLSEIENLQKKISEELKSELGINPIVKFFESESLTQLGGKVVIEYDLRIN